MTSRTQVVHGVGRLGISIICSVLLVLFPIAALVSAQNPVPAQAAAAPPPAPLLNADQLDNLVAPVALYPDALLSQVLVASTYPLEIVEASQWLQQNRNLQGQQLVEAARQQNWDPSVQALVVFPDVIGRLASNISWTTDLGNAFLAQQADVMNAVQTLRARARAAGKLNSDAEQTVTTAAQGGQTAIEIVPADPQVIYVPTYDPAYIWGPPAWGYYPALYYPAAGFGFGFDSGIYIGAYFGGWGGWSGWGWGPNWFNCTVFQNSLFFNHYGFRNYYGGGYNGGFGRGGLWQHNPNHRMGVPYPSQRIASRFGGNYIGRGGVARNSLGGERGAFGSGRFQGSARSFASQANGAGGVRGGFNGGTRSVGPRGNGATAGGWRRFGDADAGGAQRGSVAGGSRLQGQRGQSAARSFASPAGRSAAGGAGQWQHFNGFSSAPANRGNGFRSSPSNGGGFAGRSAPAMRQAPGYSGGFRSSPSYGGGFAGRSAPAMRQAPSYSGGFRSSPSYGGSFAGRSAPAMRQAPSYSGGFRSSPSYGGSRSFGGSRPSFSGGGSRSFSGGGGGGSRGGGGGSRGGGGGSRGGRR